MALHLVRSPSIQDHGVPRCVWNGNWYYAGRPTITTAFLDVARLDFHDDGQELFDALSLRTTVFPELVLRQCQVISLNLHQFCQPDTTVLHTLALDTVGDFPLTDVFSYQRIEAMVLEFIRLPDGGQALNNAIGAGTVWPFSILALKHPMTSMAFGQP